MRKCLDCGAELGDIYAIVFHQCEEKKENADA